ncbi:MAG: DUF924 domain-containing protein [Magnetococcales bacterium]|nr:DUF924 domain-containing protein [Magnetococcales bacterium]
MDRIDDVITFWFGPKNSEEFGKDRLIWFKKDDDFDESIRNRFLNLYEDAFSSKLDNWIETPDGALALCVVLDQFPRNMFRNDPRSFQSDAMARIIADKALSKGYDKVFPPPMRKFFFLPFEHSEDMTDQKRCIDLFKEAGDEEGLVWAIKHLEIIERFGRFPHRNATLNRSSTQEELDFLKQPGSSF